jgi:uncharacterized protein
MPVGEPMRIAVVADTHSHPHPDAHAQLAAGRPHAILHAGDIGELSVLDRLAEIAPLYPVRGNIDGRTHGLLDTLLLELREGDLARMRILLTHIAVRGPRLRADVRRQAAAHDAPLVICGHSHVPLIADDRGVTVFNPGSIGPRRFTLPITFGRMELSMERGLRMEHISCETGERWLPPPLP